jgi:glycine cleavage system H protein
MKIPDNLFFTNAHLWVSQIDGEWQAGITDYAQDLLGDIVFVQPPNVGDVIQNGVACGIVESVKTGSDLHAPMNGTVTEINNDLLNSPENINEKPYASWIFKFKPFDDSDIGHFLDSNAYSDLIKHT